MKRFLATFFLTSMLCGIALCATPPESPKSDKAKPAPEWALKRFKLCWDALGKDSLSERVYEICWRDLLSTGNIAPFSSELQRWALEGVQPWRPMLLRYHSLELLSIFRNDTTQQALRSLITHNDTLQVQAAQTLLKWGDWDTAAPVLVSRGMFDDLIKDPRGETVLERELRSPDLMRRLTAANVLYGKRGKQDSLHFVARTVLSLPAAERSTAATKLAVDFLSRDLNPADLRTLTHLVDADTSRWTRLGALGAIVNAAFAGDTVAFAQLEMISRDCPDPELRQRAHGYIIAAKNSRHGGAIPDSTGRTKPKQP